jgi:hypothetical protein
VLRLPPQDSPGVLLRVLEGRRFMERQGRPPASDVEVWLAQELAFLGGVERRIRRRAALARRGLWIAASLLTAAIAASVWVYVLSS